MRRWPVYSSVHCLIFKFLAPPAGICKYFFKVEANHVQTHCQCFYSAVMTNSKLDYWKYSPCRLTSLLLDLPVRAIQFHTSLFHDFGSIADKTRWSRARVSASVHVSFNSGAIRDLQVGWCETGRRSSNDCSSDSIPEVLQDKLSCVFFVKSVWKLSSALGPVVQNRD